MSRRMGRLLVLFVLSVCLLVVGIFAEGLPHLFDLATVVQRDPARFPSSLAVPANELSRGGDMLSVYTDTRNLYDPSYGLLVHPAQHGRQWERPATISYFQDGLVRFASTVGMRVHGGKSRTGSPVQSFRFYFRTKYGSEEFPSDVLFNGKGDPLSRLIAHNDLRLDGRGQWWHLVNPLAYDISRRIGALAPETQPVSFVLNGRELGLYVLTEHVRDPFLVSRFGHRNFLLADDVQRRRWMRDLSQRKNISMESVSSWLDLDGLTRWFVSVVFCATTDAFQPVIFRDQTKLESRWFFVNWDMDHSFMDLYGLTRGTPWSHDTFRTTLNTNVFESVVITRLIEEDPLYKAHLAKMFLDALNYQLTPDFLNQRFEHYDRISDWYGLGDEPYLKSLQEFLRERPAFVRRLVSRYLDVGPLHRVRIEGPANVVFTIDGREVRTGFSGWYQQGTQIHVRYEDQPERVVRWTVDGRQRPYKELLEIVRGNMVIRAGHVSRD